MSDLSSQNLVVTQTMNTLISQNNAIYHAVDRQAQIIRDFGRKLNCDTQASAYFRSVYATWLSLAPNDFARVVDSVLAGRITPDLLPATDATKVLMKHPAIRNTAYSQDLNLLYELGKFSLHAVEYDPYPMVSGVMIFPRIILERSAA